MATLLLSAAGAAVGAGFGGTVLGLSGAVIGRAIGATIGRAIDQRLLGAGSRAIDTGRVDRFRLTGASEGAAVGQVWGRMRISGQVIWASRFLEKTKTTGGGKGLAPKPKYKEHSYSVSLALALCEGEITRVGRIWADGVEIDPASITIRVYTGSEDQLPDPKIEAVEGAGLVPAYRGIAYVVLEDLELGPYGNRIPQFSFEVTRPAQGEFLSDVPDLARAVPAVAMIPGTGEYVLATTPVHYEKGIGKNTSANVHSAAGVTDFALSLQNLTEELPDCGSVSLVVSWFGDDLRCGQCSIRPKVEDAEFEGKPMAWRAGGIGRSAAQEVPRVDGRSVYGGTPADASVIEAIKACKAAGKAVMFYPFLLMDQLAGNGLTDPWTGAADQPVLPWRGRVTLSSAPGRAGSPDRSAAAGAEVAAFFGTAQAADFGVAQASAFAPSNQVGIGFELAQAAGAEVGGIVYSGPDEWSYRRFILHYAKLCVLAGGVDAFCIGSEMRGLTRIRGAGDQFVAVEALRQLAADVRAIMGPHVKIGYAADWSEYGAYDAGGGDLHFPLDPLWADPSIDFVGIDNYLPLADWRDGEAHADAHWGSIYDLDYLRANIEGGEYFDWYYASDEERRLQVRTPITDGAYGEPWVWRAKDIRGWWSNPHHERIAGVRQASATAWVPGSKPVWFTEFGCAAVDKGANEPNKFLDVRSSESGLPAFSNGRRDDLMQRQYLRAMVSYWSDTDRNPVSALTGAPMVDVAHAHVWCWDARPYPYFPANTDAWGDGGNYAHGHWITGRVGAQPLSAVVAEICEMAGVADFDVAGLYGIVRGYQVGDAGDARAALQPLMVAFGFDAAERDGKMVFRMRDGRADAEIAAGDLGVTDDSDGYLQTVRATQAEIAGRVRLAYVEAEGSYEARAVEAIFPDEETTAVAQSELALALTRAEAQKTVERWLSEARIARDGAKFALPPSFGWLGAGDVVRLADGPVGLYRIDRMEQAGAISVEAVRVEPGVYIAPDEGDADPAVQSFAAPVPVYPVFLDLPLMSGSEDPQAPHLAVTATPWPGSIAVYSSDQDAGYVANTEITAPSIIGVTLSGLDRASHGLWDRGPALRVQVSGGELSSVSRSQVLNGANLAAIGDGTSANWELFQFADAVPVAPGVYDLSLRLRGQAGTDVTLPASWPAGSTFVLLDGAPDQIKLASAERNLARHYRIGPASRSYDDPSFVHRVEAFAAIGLRPLSVCHLSGAANGAGDLLLQWVRRTRIDGDNWTSYEVPLGETREIYQVRVLVGEVLKRQATVYLPQWTYTAAMQAADGAVTQPFKIMVAQVSDAFGPGPFTEKMFND